MAFAAPQAAPLRGPSCTLPLPQLGRPPGFLTCPARILLDLNMPVLNGLAFLEAYQHLALPAAPRPVIVVLTTSLHEAKLARVRQLPIAGLLAKPLTRTRAKVASILQQHVAA